MQRKRVKAEKQEVSAAIEKAARGTVTRKRREITISAEQIIDERDTKGLSWRQVALNLDLGTPGAARAAYTQLTGKPHNTSIMAGKRAPRGSRFQLSKTNSPNWNDDSDQDEIIEKLRTCEPNLSDRAKCVQGVTITVKRDIGGMKYDEEMTVHRLIKFTYDGKEEEGPLVVHLICHDDGAYHSVRVKDIVGIR
jgi:hypothetical protein